MHISDYDFELNDNKIALFPNKERDKAKLLVVNKQTKELQPTNFSEIHKYLNKGDCIVLNDTFVFPARLYGEKINTGKLYEFLLVKENENDIWKVLIKKRRTCKINDNFIFDSKINCRLIDKLKDGANIVQFNKKITHNLLEQLGQAALPPYILKLRQYTQKDMYDYQTIYSKKIYNNQIQGSIAAPTAGLHFTAQLIEKLKNKGVTIAYITLNISRGTFKNVECSSVKDHKMDEEKYTIEKSEAEKINNAIKQNKRIIPVGTTSTRTLECSFNNGKLEHGTGHTSLFIYPGYKFKLIKEMITNFHLPKSTPLLLVSALAGEKLIKKAYKYAIGNKFSFYSYGDAMLIV